MLSRHVPMVAAHGARMPVVGYGTMHFPEPDRAVELIAHALDSGYRHIDTARKYGSERWVGEAIRASTVTRDDLWVTAKVTEEHARADAFARSVETSLETLGLDHVDLLLVHWPQPLVPLAETLGALARARPGDGAAGDGALLDDPADAVHAMLPRHRRHHPRRRRRPRGPGAVERLGSL